MGSGSMHISVVGSGYVGTTLAACLADLGHESVAIDIDETTVSRLNAGESTIHEPGLDELLTRHAGDRLRATVDHTAVVDTAMTFLAVGTPANPDGTIDERALVQAARDVGEALRAKETYHLVVIKSTVPPDVIEEQVIPELTDAAGRSLGEHLGLAVNPEFLREGSAVEDFLNPDKIVLGTTNDPQATRLLETLFRPIAERSGATIVSTGRAEACLIKYANNAFLAVKLSFINDLGNVCKAYGVDTYEIAEAIGLDHRISPSYLRSGLGWGGSCLPKDTTALLQAARSHGYNPPLIEAAIEVNELQPQRMLALLERELSIPGKRIAVLGLAFKPGTDDIRETRAIPVIEGLLERDAEVIAYDPNADAVDAMRSQFPEISYADSAEDALTGAQAACIVTDWPEFAELDWAFAGMSRPLVIDGRRIIEPSDEIEYHGLTW